MPASCKDKHTNGRVMLAVLTDSYSMSLREIDQMRVDGKFIDVDGNKAEGQYVRSLRLG